jgi:F-type H+-transporting ATPase subunit delta
MRSSFIANRYAKALLSITETESGLADKAVSFLSLCDELFELSETRKILKSPVMPSDLKKAILAYGAEKANAPAEFVNFANQVVDSGRTAYLPQISKAYKDMLAAKRGFAEATAVTAEPLSEAVKTELSTALEKVFHKKITLQNEIDKGVLGGFVVRVGNYTIDLSLKNRLNSVAEFAQR